MKNYQIHLKLLSLSALLLLLTTACGDKGGDISILATSDSFVQSAAINNKVDILWDIDSSGSMAEEQQNLADNFSAFISNFVTQGYDYHMAVTATDAWRYEYNSSFNYLAKFRDGNVYTGTQSDNSGIFMISTLTPDVVGTFRTNVKVGVTGSGDERAFDSFKQTLLYTGNDTYNFRRTDAYLAIVIVSDEEDFSRNSSTVDGCTPISSCPNLRSVQSYEDFLDLYTGSIPTDRKYNVSTITIIPGDTACMASNPSSDGHYGARHVQLANETDGVVGSICDTNFSNSLDQIAGRIAELSTQFRLDREPIVSSIVIHVNGVLIPNNATNGWTYNPTNNSIVFHGTAIPPQGASIQVDYDPTTLG
jgi:hypothetical protein